MQLFYIPDHNLKDFDIYIGTKLSSGNFVSDGYKLCYHHTGTVSSGTTLSVNCTSVTSGRYLAIQIKGSSKILTLCEVQAFAERGKFLNFVIYAQV